MSIRDSVVLARRALKSPFGASERLRPPLILHASHHKVGTVWFLKVLEEVSRRYDLGFAQLDSEPPPENANIVMYFHGKNIPWDKIDLGRTRISHIVRDPRDIAVSAYHYHMRSDEEWLHEPWEELDGRTYQEHLNSLSPAEGLSAEIRRMSTFPKKDLMSWELGRGGALEMRYEDLIADEEKGFRALFTHYGFRSEAVSESVAIAESFSLSKKPGGAYSGHARSGRPGEWREVFADEHVALFKELLNEVLVYYGYESTDQWSR